jgi:tetratricopeptide (TPR) repeat protein
MKLGRYAEAQDDFNKSTAINPNYENAYNNNGSVNLWQGNYTAALKEYAKAIAFFPNSTRAYTNKGLAEFKLGNYSEALSDYNTAIILDEKNGYAYLNIGELKLSTRDYKGAIKAFSSAIAIDTSDARVYNSLGYAYFRANNYKLSIIYANKAVAKGGAGYKPYYQYSNEAVEALKKHGIAQCNVVEWMSPVEDVNKLFNRTIQLQGKAQVTVKVKISSAQMINKQNIRVLINNQPVTDIDKVNVLSTPDSQLNTATGNFEYEYQAIVQVPPGKNPVKVMYGKKHTPELVIEYITTISHASLSPMK